MKRQPTMITFVSILGYFAILLAIPFSFAHSKPKGEDQCITCHEAVGGAAFKEFKNDIHAKKGLSCADCHGGNRHGEDQEQAMSRKAGYIGIPKKDAISERCGSCHNDVGKMKSFGYTGPAGQFNALKASVHGKRSTVSGERIIQCTYCHKAHGIRAVKDPESPVSSVKIVLICTKCHNDPLFMRQYNPGLPTDQLAKYRTSLHGILNAKGDSKPATCASCHTSHAIMSANDAKSSVYPANIPATCGKCHSNAPYMASYGIPTNQVDQYTSSVHGVALFKKHDMSAPTCNDCHGNHGAIPPGVEYISQICGSCHSLNAELFATSPHKKIFDEKNLPECETCHGNHGIKPADISLIALGENTVCGSCHSSTMAPKGYQATREIHKLLDSLQAGMNSADRILKDAEQKGLEVEDIRFSLRDANQARLQSRTAIHAFSLAKFHEVFDKGLKITEKANLESSAAVKDYFFRRWGLAIATLIITFLVIVLYAYIKRIERRQASA